MAKKWRQEFPFCKFIRQIGFGVHTLWERVALRPSARVIPMVFPLDVQALETRFGVSCFQLEHEVVPATNKPGSKVLNSPVGCPRAWMLSIIPKICSGARLLVWLNSNKNRKSVRRRIQLLGFYKIEDWTELDLRAAGRMTMKLPAQSDQEQNLFDLKEQIKQIS